MAKKKIKEETYNYNKFNQISPAANAIITVFLILLALVTVYPVALMISVSFTSLSDLGGGYKLIPQKFTLEAYTVLFSGDTSKAFWTSYGFTVFRTVVNTLLALWVMSMYAFVLAQRNFRARGFYTYFIFLTMIVSAGMIPSYIVNTKLLHLKDTIWIMILPGLTGASWVIMLRTFLTTTIPDALFESARIDGASNFVVYAKIVMPLFKPGLATIGLFNVVGKWNEWFTAILYLDRHQEYTPLGTFLQRIIRDIEWLKDQARKGGYGDPSLIEKLNNIPSESYRMAVTVLTTLPIMFAYPFFQRYFIEGLTIGSVKG